MSERGHEEDGDKAELQRRMEDTRESISETVAEIKSVVAHQYEEVRGRVETVSVEGVAASSYLGMSVTEPAEKIFRVVERRGTVCAPHGGRVKEVALDLTHPYWTVADYNYHLVFAWKIS